MRVFVTGGTGFVGSRLVPYLLKRGHAVRLLVRPGERGPGALDGVEVIEGDPMRPGPWQKAIAECEGAVNMAGFPIFGKWDRDTKVLIRDSRVLTTRHVAQAIPEGVGFRLLSTSAVGIYGDAGDRELDEEAHLGTDFLAQVARAWEHEATRAQGRGASLALTRFGIVLDRGGGAFAELEKMTRRYMGGPVGSGRQWFSWIHREDLVRALAFLLERPELQGTYNLCAPNPARQIDVARTLGRLMGRPSVTPAPAFAIRLVLGEFADVVLFSQRMVPKRLQDAGFSFRYPDLEGAIREILGRQSP